MVLRSLLPMFLALLALSSQENRFPSPQGTLLTFPDNGTTAQALTLIQNTFPGVVEDRADLASRKGDFQAGKRLFWDALDLLAQRTKTAVRIRPEQQTIQLLPAGVGATPVSVSGPFRVAIHQLNCSLDLLTQTPAASATLEVAWEPGLRPFYMETRPQGLALETGKENRIAGPDEGSSSIPVDGRLAATFPIRLPPIPRTATEIRLLEGTLQATVPTRMVSLDLPSLAKLEAAPNAEAPELSFPPGGPAGRVSSIVRTKDRWTIRLILPTPPGEVEFESYQSWIVQNDMTLHADGGKVWKSHSYLLVSNTPSRTVVAYHFLTRDAPAAADPSRWSIRYTTPAAIVHMRVPFRFVNIPLP